MIRGKTIVGMKQEEDDVERAGFFYFVSNF